MRTTWPPFIGIVSGSVRCTSIPLTCLGLSKFQRAANKLQWLTTNRNWTPVDDAVEQQPSTCPRLDNMADANKKSWFSGTFYDASVTSRTRWALTPAIAAPTAHLHPGAGLCRARPNGCTQPWRPTFESRAQSLRRPHIAALALVPLSPAQRPHQIGAALSPTLVKPAQTLHPHIHDQPCGSAP